MMEISKGFIYIIKLKMAYVESNDARHVLIEKGR